MTSILTELKIIIREYYEKMFANKLGNQDEMDKFLEKESTETDARRNRKSK